MTDNNSCVEKSSIDNIVIKYSLGRDIISKNPIGFTSTLYIDTAVVRYTNCV